MVVFSFLLFYLFIYLFIYLKMIILYMKGQVLFLQKPRMDKSNTGPLSHFLHLLQLSYWEVENLQSHD